MKRILILLFLTVCTAVAAQMPGVQASILHYNGELAPNLLQLSSKLTIESHEYHAGYSKLPLWVLFKTEKMNVPDSELYLNLATPSINKVEFYRLHENLAQMIGRAGNIIPHKEWRVRSPEVYFKVPNSHGYYLAKYQSRSPIIIKTVFTTEADYYNHDQTRRTTVFLCTGIMIAMLLYNLFIFIGVRSSEYLSYSAMTLGLMITTLALSGHAFELIWPEAVWLGGQAGNFASLAALVSAGFFSIKYLALDPANRISHRFLFVPIALGFIGLLLLFVPGQTVLSRYSPFLVFISLPVFLMAGLSSMRANFHPARYFVAAWTIMFIAIGIFIARINGLLADNLFTEYSIFSGSALTMLLLSMGLGDRLRVLESSQGHMNEQLEVGREIQKLLMPNKAPEIKGLDVHFGFEPMMQVGGDFFDIVQFDERRAGFFLCDVSGHGVPAALLASMIKIALHSRWHREFRRPEAVLQDLAKSLKGKLGDHFLTALLVHIDLDSGRIVMARAGHDPPMLINKDGDVTRLKSQGRLIADFTEPNFICASYQMKPGDLLVMYTDGVTECSNLQGVLFGENRLTEHLVTLKSATSQEIIESLLQKLKLFRGVGRFADDDTSIIAMRYTNGL